MKKIKPSLKKFDYLKRFFTIGVGFAGYSLATLPYIDTSHIKISLEQFKKELENPHRVAHIILYDEDLYEQYIEFINVNFYELITSRQRVNIFKVLDLLIKNDKDNINYFYESIKTNFNHIVETKSGLSFLQNIIESRLTLIDRGSYNKGKKTYFSTYDNDAIINDLVELCFEPKSALYRSMEGIRILWDFLLIEGEISNKAGKLIFMKLNRFNDYCFPYLDRLPLDYLKETVTHHELKEIVNGLLINTPRVSWLAQILWVIKHINEETPVLIKEMFLESIKKSIPMPYLTEGCIDRLLKPNDQSVLIPLLMDNIALAAQSPGLANLITSHLKNNPQLASQFCKTIINFWNKIEDFPYAFKLAQHCIIHDTTTIPFFISQIKPSSNLQYLEVVCINASGNKDLKNKLEEVMESNSLNNFEKIARLISYSYYCTHDSHSLLSKIPSGPTKRHLIQNKHLFLSSQVLSFYSNNKELSAFANAIMTYEGLLQNNYYTFVHGQKSCYLLPELLYTFLNKIKYDTHTHQDFIYLHVKKLNNDLKSEKQLRKSILKNGRGLSNHPFLLFTNYTLFGNEMHGGENTAKYIAVNANQTDVELNFDEIFYNHDLPHDIYNKYKARLEHLQREYLQLTPYGTCILIAIPKVTAHKHVYLTLPEGYKNSLEFKNGITTNDMQLFMKKLEKSPELIKNTDELIFCIPMTTDKNGGLNPESAIKVFPFS
ncbi:MAG: hypothetical protein ACLPWD_06460, partial [Methanobacterium sp.]